MELDRFDPAVESVKAYMCTWFDRMVMVSISCVTVFNREFFCISYRDAERRSKAGCLKPDRQRVSRERERERE